MPKRSPPVTTVAEQQRRDSQLWFLAGTILVGLALLTVGFSVLITPGQSLIALTLLTLCMLWVVMRPIFGVYMIMVFTLLGDSSTTPWFPFAKNFSSYESILFVSDRLIINPLEVVLLLTAGSWLVTGIGDNTWRFHRGVLFTPLMVFGAFVLSGLLYGLARGGSVNVGLWEARPLVYLPSFYILVTNLVSTPAAYRRLMFVAMGAITGQAVLGLLWYSRLSAAERGNLESLTEHSASVHFNAVIMLLLATMLFPGSSRTLRAGLALMAVPVAWAYLVAERRSAFVGLALGIILFCILLFKLQRRRFWWFSSIVAVLSLFYLVVFWNGSGPVAFPAQAIKAVVAPSQVSGADQSSAEYRDLEARNIWYTLRVDPVRGIGFGHAFYRPYPLPDISFFPFWEYMPHHSFLWIWLKTGAAGFVSMLFLMARTIQHGVKSVLRAAPGDGRAIAVAAVLYVVMYLVFSYVDIAWDIRSMIFLAAVMAMCADMVPHADGEPDENIDARIEESQRRRVDPAGV